MTSPSHDSPKSKLARLVAPGYGYCGRCGLPWKFVEGHSTTYSYTPEGWKSSACFPLCEACWALLSPEERLPYYMDLMDRWDEDGDDYNGAPMSEIREIVRQAVLAGR